MTHNEQISKALLNHHHITKHIENELLKHPNHPHKELLKDLYNHSLLNLKGSGLFDDVKDKATDLFLKYNPISLLLKSVWGGVKQDLANKGWK